MVIRVNPSKAVVSSISYIEPEFNASWLEVQVEAACSFPDFLGVEIVTPADAVSLNPIKGFDEFQAVADLYNHEFAKNPSEALSAADVFYALLILIRTFADTLDSPTDELDLQVTKNLSEVITELEALAFVTNKPLADSFALPELAAKHLQKLILGIAQDYADPSYFAQNYVENGVVGDWIYTTNDVLTKEVTYGRTAADSVSSGDELQPFQLGKGIRDTIVSQEYREMAYSKSMVGDSLFAIDNMDGNIQYQVVKVVGEMAIVSDAQAVDYSTQKADNMLTSDTGLIVVQDYVEPGYFLQNYVGFSQTF